jgi:hypothetical protein
LLIGKLATLSSTAASSMRTTSVFVRTRDAKTPRRWT